MSELNLIGTTLGRFEILSELGRGGMAVVYRARQTDLDRIIALKILPPALTYDNAYVARFRQEARSAARLEHPHIMPIYEVGEANGLHYIAMKFIEGRTVKDLLQDEGALSVARAATLLAQVGDALDYAHRQGVIHRDIKPSNMMVTREGWVFLTDFGLARGAGNDSGGLTMAGTVMGTPEYMSPEQAQGLPTVGPATDIYALGVVLYELLTGSFPFKADTPMGMLAARLLQAPIPPRDMRSDLPVPVEDVVMRSLARKPEARFASAADMVRALRAAAGIGNAEPQRPETPMAGLPAVGATIKAPAFTPPPPHGLPPLPTPPSSPPYVRPSSLPPITAPATAPLAPQQQAFGIPAGAATPVPAAPTARKSPNNLVVIGIALAIAMIAGCVGLLLAGGDSGGTTVATTVPTTAVGGELQTLLVAGDEAMRDDGFADALATYEEAQAEAPGDPAVLERLALAYSAHGDYRQAEDLANQLIDTSTSSDPQVALGYAILADALASQGNVVAASEAAAEAVRIDPELALGHAIESNVLAARALAAGRDAEMDEALAALDRAVDSLGDESELLQALTHSALAYTFAQEYMLSGDRGYYDQSEASYEQAIDLMPNLGLFPTNLAYLRLLDDEYDDARDGFAEALELDPELAMAQAGIGWSHYWEGDSAAAAEAFEAAIALDDGQFEGHYGLGRIAFDDASDPASYGLAAERLRMGAERNPNSAEVHGYLGESLLFQGFGSEDGSEAQDEAYASAEAAYRTAIERNDRYAFALSGLGWILQYQEEYEESVSVFDQVITLDDANDENHNGRAWSLYNLGRYEEAEASFRAAIERDSDNNYASAHYGLGRTLQELGRNDEARAAYEATLAIDPDYTSAQEALDTLP